LRFYEPETPHRRTEGKVEWDGINNYPTTLLVHADVIREWADRTKVNFNAEESSPNHECPIGEL
jgi:hypothetical protein